MQTLTTLDLGWNRIRAAGATHVSRFLMGDMVRSRSIVSREIFPVDLFVQPLTSLNLENNDIGNQGAQHLANAFVQNRVRRRGWFG